MDREELNDWIRKGPIRITMNSGDTVDIQQLYPRMGAEPAAQFEIEFRIEFGFAVIVLLVGDTQGGC